jgi:hypothetical protein
MREKKKIIEKNIICLKTYLLLVLLMKHFENEMLLSSKINIFTLTFCVTINNKLISYFDINDKKSQD